MKKKKMMQKNESPQRVFIVGGGPAGMACAAFAAEQGAQVTLFEKNKQLGKKLSITGKGRCNLTNNCDVETVLHAVVRNPRFLQSALHAFPPNKTIELFEQLGCPLKTERGNRVFPCSDRAADIVGTLKRWLTRTGVTVCYESVTALILDTSSTRCLGVQTTQGAYHADAVVLATGGLSYPTTGSTGDGYRFAAAAGHTIVHPAPSLIPLEIKEPDCAAMAGLSLKNAALHITRISDGKTVYTDFGEMLFTHFGVSGPMILSASAHLEPTQMQDYVLHLDFKPALDAKALDIRIQSDFSKNANRDFANALDALLPRLLIPAVIRRSKIPPHSKVHQITKQQRLALCGILKDYTLHPYGMRPIAEAIVTRGGVSTIEVNPRTMASKCCAGLFFAGELLDIDAYTGGFNLQLCFATAFAAARGVAKFISAKSDVSERI